MAVPHWAEDNCSPSTYRPSVTEPLAAIGRYGWGCTSTPVDSMGAPSAVIMSRGRTSPWDSSCSRTGESLADTRFPGARASTMVRAVAGGPATHGEDAVNILDFRSTPNFGSGPTKLTTPALASAASCSARSAGGPLARPSTNDSNQPRSPATHDASVMPPSATAVFRTARP